MEQLDDSALLRQYVESQSDEAFAALVTRYINLVYSVALRETASPENSEEIAQAVFIMLARKAKQLRHEKALSSWLFQATRLTSANLLRSESRRLNREQETYMQSALNDAPDETWMKIAPLLDSAVASLREKDRRAILLRFYEGRNLQEVGAAMGASENAAGKRVNRALDNLRNYFAKRGINSTTAIIAEKISTHSVQAAPAALAKTVVAAAVAKGVAGSASTLTLVKGALKLMAWTKAKTALVATGILLVAGTGAVIIQETSLPSEPSYGGRRLSDWMVDADFGQPQEKRQIAGDAIRKMGKKSIPFLLAALGDEKYTNRYRIEEKQLEGYPARQAVWAFDALGPIGKSAIPELQRLVPRSPGFVTGALGGIGSDAMPVLLEDFKNENFWVRDNSAAAIANAIFALKVKPEEVSAAFPIALSNLTYVNTNSLYQNNTRSRAAWLLGALRQSPEITVPALIAGLQDSNASVASDCAFALSQFGKDAKVAIPDLARAADSTNRQLSVSAKQSLEMVQNAR